MISRRRIMRISQFADAAYNQSAYALSRQAKNESHCRYVSSRGIKRSCRFWSRNGAGPTGAQLKQDAQSHNEDLATIYVKADQADCFVNETLDEVDRPFVLVTGDCDVELVDEDIPAQLRDRLFAHPLLKGWFAQNCLVEHPKLHPMPIGLDYHTLTTRLKRHPWGYFSTPLAQEKSLDETRIRAPNLQDKELAAYCNWHHALQRGDRLQCIRNVQVEAMVMDEINISRNVSWQNNARHLFTISPLGEATDCHRTWEALLLGTVPIVSRSGISSLFTDLPVCIVDDWREVTVEYLQKKREWALETTFDFGPLYLDWWKARIQGETVLPNRKQRFQDFVETAHQPAST